ncbi:MAG: glycosyltransferase family 2 protein [Deltaproteobacteria bacterium]|nr:glycosyltransferase family 2 protein [Deltaproteobacteria bacterium]
MSDAAPHCSVVVPCYRSEKTVQPLLERLRAVFAGLNLSYEVVFVDDDSPDGVGAALDALRAADPEHVGVVHLLRNAGQHAAIMAGLPRVRGQVVVTMDDDLQHPPEEIPRLLDALQPGVDVVYGGADHRRHAAWRNAGSALVRALMVATIGKPRRLVLSSFRVMRREVADALTRARSPYLFLDAEIFRVTTRAVHVEVEHHQRADWRSSYTFRALLRLATNLLFNHSALPLRMISVLGISAAALALVFGSTIIAKRILGIRQQTGWPSLAVLVTFFGGATLFSLGMIGEYLIRIIHQTAQRPQFHVRREDLPGPGPRA